MIILYGWNTFVGHVKSLFTHTYYQYFTYIYRQYVCKNNYVMYRRDEVCEKIPGLNCCLRCHIQRLHEEGKGSCKPFQACENNFRQNCCLTRHIQGLHEMHCSRSDKNFHPIKCLRGHIQRKHMEAKGSCKICQVCENNFGHNFILRHYIQGLHETSCNTCYMYDKLVFERSYSEETYGSKGVLQNLLGV